MTVDHAEAVMRQLPARVRKNGGRHQYAQLMTSVLNLAVYPLRLIERSPLPRGFMPKVEKSPGHGYLYPTEDAQTLACSRVSIQERVLHGFLAREGLRPGEAVRLQIADFDLERGSVCLEENKTDDPRAWALDPAVVRALRGFLARYRPEAKPTDLMFVDTDGRAFSTKSMAAAFRTALKIAGVTRSELFERGPNWMAIRAHDLRGTFVTLSLANGKTETWVADRTGHRSSVMINRYRRQARSAEELGLGPLFPPLFPLDHAIPELSPVFSMVEGLRAASSIQTPPPPREMSQSVSYVQRDVSVVRVADAASSLANWDNFTIALRRPAARSRRARRGTGQGRKTARRDAAIAPGFSDLAEIPLHQADLLVPRGPHYAFLFAPT